MGQQSPLKKKPLLYYLQGEKSDQKQYELQMSKSIQKACADKEVRVRDTTPSFTTDNRNCSG